MHFDIFYKILDEWELVLVQLFCASVLKRSMAALTGSFPDLVCAAHSFTGLRVQFCGSPSRVSITTAIIRTSHVF